ncbi:double-stranded RNA-binding protein Staufen isoform X2 [Lycorma delicatula]|uniref:double-stranded RNA-binding protein Staufen isoform X2 n=1 Tax=Lycorma delicatula TaxID=130591 RepID=UPI003F513F1E
MVQLKNILKILTSLELFLSTTGRGHIITPKMNEDLSLVLYKKNGRSTKLCYKWMCLMYCLSLIPGSQSMTYHQTIQITDEDLNSLFGPNNCITGVLAAMASQPVPPLQDSTITCGAGGDECPSVASDTQEKESQQGSIEMANTKEKTPMCLVNELARYNKIVHQYRLTGEQGPPHQKKFMVTLKLGEKEYSAEGASIKKAQHAAANYALRLTDYEHPPPKASKNSRLSNITPTVELNALAMRRGEPTTYTILEPTSHNNFNYHHRGMYNQPRVYSNYTTDFSRRNMQPRINHNVHNQRFENQRNYGSKGAALYRVSVKVGEKEFLGEGITAQAARHDAASKALEELRNLPVDTNNRVCKGYTVEGADLETSSDLKSPISLVHEVALKRNLTVSFEVVNEKGPPHMRTFVTRCRVGDSFETTGEGNGKKISKKRAAEKMLEELRSLPPTTVITASGCTGTLSRLKRKPNASKKKSRNLIKVTNTNTAQEKSEPETVIDEINPISRLIQIQQAKKEREPLYTLKEERGQARRREFLMEVTVGEYSYVGSGPNKKLAKRNAAEGLLQEMGYSSTSQTGIRKQMVFVNGDKVNGNVGGTGGRQLVPGLLLMTDSRPPNGNHNKASPGGNAANLQATAHLVKEYLNGGSVPHTNDMRGSHVNSGSTAHAVRPKEQLLYLAKLLGFKVQFSDFPKGNHSEYLSLVSLSTEPPQVCHGSGKTTDNSHDQAALTALRALAEMGLDSVTTTVKKENSSLGPGGDQLFTASSSNNAASNNGFINGASGK